MSDNLDNLSKIAEAATPGPWEMREENPQMDGRNFTLRVRDQAGIRMSTHCYGFNGDPEFIATFDPPTVLALLSRLEQAEQAVARVREAIKDAPTSDPTRGFAGPPDDYPDIEHFIGNGEWSVAERVRNALDGEQE